MAKDTSKTKSEPTYSSIDAKRFFEAFDKAVEAQPKDIRALTEKHGFEVAHTGGGCLAYEYPDPKLQIWITDTGGLQLPKSPDEPSLYGLNDENNEWLTIDEATAAEMLSVNKTMVAFGRQAIADPDFEKLRSISLREWLRLAAEAGFVDPSEAEAVDRLKNAPAPAP